MVGALLAALRPRASLVAENLALRQQLAVVRSSHFHASVASTTVTRGRVIRGTRFSSGQALDARPDPNTGVVLSS